MKQNLFPALTLAVTQIFLGGIYVMLLVEFREPVRTWRLRWLLLVGGIVAANVAWVALGHFDFYARFGVLILVVPYALATVWCSKYRGFRTVFSVGNGAYVGCICGVNGYVAQALVPDVVWLPLAVRVASLILLYFVLKKFAQTCRKMLRQLDCGWVILSLIPITTSLLMLYTNYVYFRQDPLPAAIVLYGLIVVCACSYYLMYLFFGRVQKEDEARRNAQLSALQLSALRSRIDAIQTVEEAIRIERHDLRHRFRAVAELVAQGKDQEALAFIGAAQTQLEERKPVRWCRPPVLDAVFSSYFSQAQRKGIRVDARIALADELPVDEADLAIVFSNALENAIYACMRLPEGRREIRCRVISHPGLMFEVSNPYAGAVRFDERGLPVSSRQGHGTGSHSIAAFCEKHGAFCQYTARDGVFSLRVVL